MHKYNAIVLVLVFCVVLHDILILYNIQYIDVKNLLIQLTVRLLSNLLPFTS